MRTWLKGGLIGLLVLLVTISTVAAQELKPKPFKIFSYLFLIIIIILAYFLFRKIKHPSLKGAEIGFLIPAALWVWASVSEGCLLPFGELLNVGGANCGWYGAYGSFLINFNNFLIIFGIPALIGLGLGAIIGWIIGKKKEAK